MLEKYCDIQIVGTELPGLITAAFLAKRGLSVQVIDPDFYSDHPHLPDPVCITHAQSKLLKSIMGRLNVPEMTIQNFLGDESNLQAVFPSHRIDVLSNPLFYYDELEREFPTHLEELKSFYEKQANLRFQIDVNDFYSHLIPNTWGERRAFKNFVLQHNLNQKGKEFFDLVEKHPTLSAFFRAQFLLAYQSSMKSPFAYQIAELLNPGDGEVFSLLAGSRRLKKLLIDRITANDGHIRKKCFPQNLLIRNGVMEGVELSESQEHVLSRYVVWNTSLTKLEKLLPNKWKYRNFKKECLNFETPYHWFTARYQIAAQYIPEPMKRNLISVQNPQKELNGVNFLYINLSDPTRSDQRYLDVHFLLPKSALEENYAFFKPYFEKIELVLKKFLPFSQDSLKHVFPLPNDSESLETLFPMNENDFDVFKYSAEQNGVLQKNPNHFNDLFSLNYRSPAPNLFVSHPYVFYGLGLDAKLTLGLKVTDIIWQEFEKDKKRAMKSERRIA